MDSSTKIIGALAALLGAVAWPTVMLIFLMFFTHELRAIASRVPALLDRIRKMTVVGVVAELDALADKAPKTGEVTAEQTRAAAELVIESREVGKEHLFAELDKLCFQYDTIRRSMAAGLARTQEMSRIIVKMRALGPSTSTRINVYKDSGSAGSRLAAVAMMQMEPGKADLDWLLERFRIETPFVFYHASLALVNAANSGSEANKRRVLETAKTALEILQSFKGTPDKNTIDQLKNLMAG